MMVWNMLVQIEKRLRQASGQEDLPYGEFIVILVGRFNCFHLLVINQCILKEMQRILCYSTISQMLLYWNNPGKKLETHQKSWNPNGYFRTFNKTPLLINTGWIYLNYLLEHNMIQIMVVGIKLVECFMTKIPPLNTTCRGCKHWKSQSLNYKHAITAQNRSKKIPKKQMAYITVYILIRELM